MPALIGLSLVLQAICLVHMVRTGRPYWWAFILFAGSYLGVAVYFFTQILPDLQHDPRARRAARGVVKRLDPERDLRRLRDELVRADTFANRLKLAREFLDLGEAGEAETLLQSCRKGLHADDADLLLLLAQAQFAQDKAAEARSTLDALIQANPQFRSPDGHLLYARCLEACGEHEAALAEYCVLDDSYPGEEARVRHASLLISLGRRDEARGLCTRTLSRSRVAPKYYQRAQQSWIDQAKRILAQ